MIALRLNQTIINLLFFIIEEKDMPEDTKKDKKRRHYLLRVILNRLKAQSALGVEVDQEFLTVVVESKRGKNLKDKKTKCAKY